MPVIFSLLLPIIFLIFVVGSSVLWARTRRAAALVQLIACSVILMSLAVEKLADYLMRAGKPELFDAIHSSPVLLISQLALLVSFVVFPIGYLWHALSQKRI